LPGNFLFLPWQKSFVMSQIVTHCFSLKGQLLQLNVFHEVSLAVLLFENTPHASGQPNPPSKIKGLTLAQAPTVLCPVIRQSVA
jgi:hypothetical protein